MVFWKVPYGYRRSPRRDGVPAHVELFESEAQVVRQIFAWHVDERLSIRQIALRLTESPHPSATGLPRWGPSTVRRLLQNEAYIGTMYYNRHESLDGDPKTTGRRRRHKSRTRCRPAAEWIPLSVPPLLSKDVFRRSQALHPENTRFSPRHLKSGHYLLRGLVWLFAGLGILIALAGVTRGEAEKVWMLGFIPTGVGLAYLIYYFVEVFPGSREQRRAAKAARAIARVLEPDAELKKRVADLEVCGSVDNRMALAEH